RRCRTWRTTAPRRDRRHRGARARRAGGSATSSSVQVHQGEQHHPESTYEIPVDRAHLQGGVTLAGEDPAAGEHLAHGEPEDGSEHVRPVTPDEEIESGSVHAAAERQPVVDQAYPLCSLDTQEEDAEG